MDLFEKTISNDIVYEGKIFNLDKIKVLLSKRYDVRERCYTT